MYKLVNAKKQNISLLVKYKLETIFEYAVDIDKNEESKIINYVNTEVPQLLKDYKLIVVDSNIVGCLLIVTYEDGIMLDEIYLEENYRGLGIGSAIINNLIKKQNLIYLWVYKKNDKAIKLYEKFIKKDNFGEGI